MLRASSAQLSPNNAAAVRFVTGEGIQVGPEVCRMHLLEWGQSAPQCVAVA